MVPRLLAAVTAVVDEQLVITKPGVYQMPADAYHADPVDVDGGSLSASGAHALLACPARFDYDRTSPRPPSRVFDLGHAAHRVTLGAGAELEIVDAADWRTKAAQQKRDEAYAGGRTPVLSHEWAQVRSMHYKLLAHPLARRLFTDGEAEQVLVWQDETTGVWCRAMLDYLRPPWIVDYKTADSASLAALVKSVVNHGYDLQNWWYLDGVRALGLAEEPAFLFVAQEKTPPYLVTVFQLDDEFMARAEARARRAREMFRDCTEAGVWPGYTDDVATLALPRRLRFQEEY